MKLLIALALAANAQSFGTFKLPSLQLLGRAPYVPAAVTVFDLEQLYDNGVAPTSQDLTGWYAGRRFTAKGPAAQLLAGHIILKDPAQGPLEGSILKVTAFGGDKPSEHSPVTYFDNMGANAVDGILWNLIDRSGKAEWKAVDLKDTGAVAQDGDLVLQIRKNNNLLVAKYGNGDYAYFFKKVR